jgi:hypothetical protein
MPNFDLIHTALDARIDPSIIVNWRRPCRPRILAVTDGSLNYTPSDGFGLWRFLQAITVAPGVTNKPVLTLAHRGVHPTPTVTVGSDVYNVISNFHFAGAATPVTLANYDQVWMWGIDSGPFVLSNADVGVLSEFMNGGGGVFATGDHAALGRSMCGSLPRIRHMREWRDAGTGGVPMGIENDVNVAINRIDTVVNPGSNAIHEFDDQSDDIPQRIYPNYKVTDTDGLGGTQWSATVHPLLMLPGALATRNSTDAAGANTEFTNDMDVLPDHPHESQCYEVTNAGTLGGTYNLSGQNFAEFQPSSADPAQRVGAQVVAYAVSGGRAVYRSGYWKPPVKPRMFGVISAYDGRLAQAYPGKTQRPGRVVCDSTWHHYINVNLDGTSSGRSGLGTGSGAGFVPSAQLEKIYTYYRNIVSWLQPANRVWCNIFWDLAAVRVNPALYEELLERDHLTGWRDWVGVGTEARKLLTAAYGSEHVRDQIAGLLLSHESTASLGDMIAADQFAGTSLDANELIDGVLGSLLVQMAHIVPPQLDAETAKSALGEGPAKHIKVLQARLEKAAEQGLMHQVGRIEKSLKLARRVELKSTR